MTTPTPTPASDSLPARFLALAGQLAAFHARHGRLPVQCDAEDPYERNLGDFLRVNRRALTLHLRGEREGTVKARVEYLDKIVPGWRNENSRPNRTRVDMTDFSARVKAAAQFINQHDRFPSTTSPVYVERSLGDFLANMRQARLGRGTLIWDDTREAMLNAEVPGWDRATVEGFDKRLGDLAMFVAENGRPPRRYRGKLDEQSDERRHESSLTLFVWNVRASANAQHKRAVAHALAA